MKRTDIIIIMIIIIKHETCGCFFFLIFSNVTLDIFHIATLLLLLLLLRLLSFLFGR